MGVQKLSSGARARKAERDLCYAKGWVWNKETCTCSKSGSGTPTSQHKRRQKKAESQRKNCPTGQHFDHKRRKCVSAKSNLSNQGKGTKEESGANYTVN